MVLFVDEVGNNTSQKKYGNIGGEKFVVENNQWALIWSSYSDSHFTILGFMTVSGTPVCCVIILACMEVKAKIVLGLQPWAEV